MEITKLFKITVTKDERRSELFGYFANEAVGLSISKGKGWYGDDGYSNEVKVIKLSDGSYVEVGAIIPRDKVNDKTSLVDAKREAALGKLSLEERELLGL